MNAMGEWIEWRSPTAKRYGRTVGVWFPRVWRCKPSLVASIGTGKGLGIWIGRDEDEEIQVAVAVGIASLTMTFNHMWMPTEAADRWYARYPEDRP
jgi:hypothetical protein